MSNKEVNIRSIIFLVIGVLLLLSLVICIYIVYQDKDLVEVDATVIDVKKDSDGTGKNDVTVEYDVGNVTYKYNAYFKDDVNVDDKITIYYHEDNVTSVRQAKTSKLIFISPVLGLVLCVLGLFELFKKDNDEDDLKDFQTQVISIVGNTQKLQIVTDDKDETTYVKTAEEEEETKVKSIIGKIDDRKTKGNDSGEEVKSSKVKPEDEGQKANKIDKVVKEIKKVLPNDYYISGNALVYSEIGKETKEIDLHEVKNIIKTINSENKVIKIVVETDEIRCILTVMRKIDLEEIANLLHNRMVAIYGAYEEKVEYKEY